jgi:hypothetical protein
MRRPARRERSIAKGEDRSEARTAVASEDQHGEREDRSEARTGAARPSAHTVTSGEPRPFIQP